MLDPNAWKDLPTVIAILLAAVLITSIVYKIVKAVLNYMEKNTSNLRDLIEKQNEYWRMFEEKQSLTWRNFIKDITEENNRSNDLVATRLSELATITKSLVEEFKDHDARTQHGHRRTD